MGLLQKEFRPFLSVLSVFAAMQTAVIITVGVVMACKHHSKYHMKGRVCLKKEQLVQEQETLEEEEKVYEEPDNRPPRTYKKSVYTKNVAYAEA